MINVTKGWPNGHASEASYPVLAGQDVVEGDFVLLVDDGDGNPVWRLMTSADVQNSVDQLGGQALDSNTAFAYDVRYTGMLPVVRNNYTAQTDRFTPDAYAPGDLLEIDPARPGIVRRLVAGAIVGAVESHDPENGLLKITRR